MKRRATQLVLGRSKSCRSCAASLREAEKSPFWKGIGPMSAQYLNRLTHRGKSVTCTLQDLYDQWRDQRGRCALSNVFLDLEGNTDKHEPTASVDRIDSSKGYHKDNIQWVHKRVNTMKNNMTDEELVIWCRRIVHIAKKKGGTNGS